MDEVSEASTNKPRWLFGFTGAEARQHGMVRAVDGKKFSCTRCGMRRLHNGVSGVCWSRSKREKLGTQLEGCEGTTCSVLLKWEECDFFAWCKGVLVGRVTG